MAISEAARQANHRWAQRNKDKISARHRRKRLESPELFMWKAARERARKRDIEFTIAVSDITIPENCPVFGFPIGMTAGKRGGGDSSASLDRIDPTKGYVPGNVQVMSRKANVMKSNATVEELKQFSDWINKTYA